MNLQMYLLEQEMEAENNRAEEIAIKLIRRGRPFQEIYENTNLSLERIHQLAQSAFKDNNYAK